ncbi:hypothetical protein [Acerihabitans arboris]|uniref:Uncharacterized protein n=1 Tax=Acerihabitans arboris TaxID=2691583 RepID=A0A845SG25_9GAMM|nr:hypothetical protein [Acerihabitans arboris]NDL64013.1 hypothetical protein [Acerihabitans arboris]
MPQCLLEVNSPLIWHWSHFLEMAAVMEKYRFTGLVIHQQNILALLAQPSPHYQGADKANLQHEWEGALLYLQRLSAWCRARRLTVWLQGEAFPQDGRIEHKFPELSLADDAGRGEKFLYYFYTDVVSASLAQLPLIDGIILSLQTPAFNETQWHAPLLSLYRQLRRQNKKLALRDYTDDSWPRRQLHQTLARLPGDVRASLKATAVDYRPGFANNPAIGAFDRRRMWIDIDLWGIDYGWTLLPCLLIDEIQGRLGWVQTVIGERLEAISVRISWEWINNGPLLDSVNESNLYGLARMVNDAQPAAAVTLLDDWLEAKGARPVDGRQRQMLRQLFFTSYDWMCKAPYLLGRVMHCHSQIPQDINDAWRLLNSGADGAHWRASFQPLFPADDRDTGLAQRELIRLERQQVEFLARHLRHMAQQLEHGGALPAGMGANLAAAWERAEWYSRMFGHVRQLLELHGFIDKYGDSPSLRAELATAIAAAGQCADKIDRWLDDSADDHPLYLRMMMNPARLHALAQQCRLR